VDLDAIDRNLAALRGMVATMSTNLVDLETDAGRTRLDQSPLTGTTATQWSQASSDLAALWQWFTQLNDILAKATELRGTKARLDQGPLAQLDWLVNGPSVELSTANIPVAERGLFGPAETTVRCSPPQLLELMRSAFDHVVAVIRACSQRWSSLDSRLTPLSDQLATAERLAAAAGESHHPELDQARAQLEGLRQAAMCDPLTASEDSVAAVAASLNAVVDDLRQVVQLRENLGARLTEARSLVAELQAATKAATDARVEALAKVAQPAVTDTQPVADSMAAELDRMTAMAARGEWRPAASLLAQWTTRCRDALAAAQRATETNRAPIATRDELRGRLDAYRAKAYRLGRLEDPAVAALYARAKEELFTAPTDLAAAEELVRRYQQALAGPSPREVAT
jgi:hypothetical protein